MNSRAPLGTAKEQHPIHVVPSTPLSLDSGRRISRKRAGRLGLLLSVLLLVALLLAVAFPQPAQALSYGTEELAFAQLLNDYRVGKGLQPLLISDMLSEAADRHSSDMGTYRFFDHYTSGGSDWFALGSSPWDRMAASGYTFKTTKGENIAAGQTTGAAAFQTWRESAPHNANMVSADFRVVGISLVQVSGSPYGFYWTTDFGGYADPTAHELSSTTAATGVTQQPPTATTPPPPTQSGRFSDVGSDTLYRDEIALLAELGIVSGYEDGSFRPTAPVTRQQFAKMIALTLRFDVYPVTASGFSDVQARLGREDTRYPGGYIAACVAVNVIEGKSADTFAPFDNVTRAQLITMVSRAARLPELAVGLEPPFAEFSSDHFPWAARAWAAGLLEGLPGVGPAFDFWADATRAEACLLLYELLALGGPSSE